MNWADDSGETSVKSLTRKLLRISSCATSGACTVAVGVVGTAVAVRVFGIDVGVFVAVADFRA